MSILVWNYGLLDDIAIKTSKIIIMARWMIVFSIKRYYTTYAKCPFELRYSAYEISISQEIY